MKNQSFNIKLSLFDQLAEVISSVMMIILISLPLFYYYKIPSTIALSLNSKGYAEYFVSAEFIWVLPVIGLLIYLSLHALSIRPNIYIIPKFFKGSRHTFVKVSSVIRLLKFITTSASALLTYGLAQMALS